MMAAGCESAGAACSWAGAWAREGGGGRHRTVTAARKPSELRMLIPCVYMRSSSRLIRNVHGAIARRHLRPFGIPDDQAHQVRAGLNVKTGLHREAGAAEAVHGGLEETHLNDFLATGHKIAVFIENGGGDSKVIAIAAFGFAEANAFEI